MGYCKINVGSNEVRQKFCMNIKLVFFIFEIVKQLVKRDVNSFIIQVSKVINDFYWELFCIGWKLGKQFVEDFFFFLVF